MDRRWRSRKPRGIGRIVLVLSTLATGLVLFAPSQASAYPPAVTVTSDPGTPVRSCSDRRDAADGVVGGAGLTRVPPSPFGERP